MLFTSDHLKSFLSTKAQRFYRRRFKRVTDADIVTSTTRTEISPASDPTRFEYRTSVGISCRDEFRGTSKLDWLDIRWKLVITYILGITVS